MKKLLLFITALTCFQGISQISTFPYTEDFESGAGGWTSNGTITTWELGTPTNAVISAAASGVNAWVTSLTGNYTNNEDGYVMSPEFDFTAVASPSIQFNLIVYTESWYDGLVLQSSIDGGATWQNVGNLGDPNWYNNSSIWGNPGGQQTGWDGTTISTWTSVNHALTGLAGQSSVFLRLAFGSDGSVTYEGVAFDDIYVYNETCPSPSALSATYNAPDTLILNWTNGLSETAWNVEYGPSGFTPGSGTMAAFDNNPDTLTGFSANSLYDFYIQADCGGGDLSVWQGPFSASTLYNDDVCNAVMVPVDGSTTVYSNVGATTQVGEPGTSPNNTVWFQFVVPASGNVAIGTCDENFDTELEVFAPGATCSNFATFSSIGYADWNPWNCSGMHPAGIELCGLTPDDTITFWVGSWSNGSTGTFPLTVWELAAEAGTGSTVDVCVSDSINLWNTISGQADNSGYWYYPNNPNTIYNDSIFVTGNATVAGDEVYYIISNACEADTATVNIVIYGPSTAGNDGTIDACKNEPINLLSGLSGLVDLGGTWYDPGNNALAGDEITTGAIMGQYNYDYITNNGVCPDDTANVVVNVLDCDYLDIQELYMSNVEVYPNPASDQIFVSNNGSSEVFSYELTDINGKLIAEKSNAINGTTIQEVNIKQLENGVYFMRIFNDNAEKTFRIVKQ